MTENKIARIAVTITQVIKTQGIAPPQDILKIILDALPDCTVGEIQEYFFRLADQMGIKYLDINHIIWQLQTIANESTDLHRKGLWQTIGNILYIVGRIASGLLPGKWSEVSKVILDVYEKEFKN